MEEHRKRVIQYEDRLLEAISFNFSVSHAYKSLLRLGKTLMESGQTMTGAFEVLQRLYQSSIILHHPPVLLAAFSILEARKGKSIKVELKWLADSHIDPVDLKILGELYAEFVENTN